MLKILVKKQLTEIFRAYIYDAKKNRARSKAATIGYIVFFVLLMGGVIGGMFTTLSLTMCRSMAEAGMSWFYFAIMGLMAILLGAFQNYGIQPGPQLFDTNGAMVWALIASMYIGNVMLLILYLPLVGLWVKLLNIPKSYLYAGILVFSTLGVYGMRQSAFDLVLLYAIGLLGVVMRRFDFPAAPVVVGMILGPLAEAQMRNAVAIGEGKWTIFLERPGSLTLIVIVLCVLIIPRLLRRWAAKKLRAIEAGAG